VPVSKQRRYDWVTFTSDYGLDDVFVGVCKGVVAQIAPHVRILDVCHLVAAQDVQQGATSLAAAIPYLPVAIHLALVDPMQLVSSRGVVVETADGSLLVGPDNGMLSLAWDQRGGISRAVEISNPQLWRETVHKTFRGRDVFAPVAAHLANGDALADVGPKVDAETLTRLPVRGVIVDDDHVHAEVSLVDHFGNVSLNLARSDLEAAGITFGDTVELRCNGRTMAVPFTATYGDVPRGRLTLCEDSFRAVMLAVNAGHASRELRVSRGEPVVIARLPQQSARPGSLN
jgi:S-adenosyl-L-methionine hydrolase (adenosine-forming)